MSHSSFIHSTNGWVMVQDPTSKRMYYINLKTNQTRWTLPEPNQQTHSSHKSQISIDNKYNNLFNNHKNDINDWIMLQDPISNKMYYSNIKTKQTQWHPPILNMESKQLQCTIIDENDSDNDSDNDVLLIDSDHITIGSPLTIHEQKLDNIYNEVIDDIYTDDENIDHIIHIQTAENQETDYENILNDMNDSDIINQLMQFGYNQKQIINALETVQKKHLIYDINNILSEIECVNEQNNIDEFMIIFDNKPFGMKLAPMKNDQMNLFVRDIENNSLAQKHNLMVGAKLIGINGENIEDIGCKKIFQCLKEAQLPVSIMFRKKIMKKY